MGRKRPIECKFRLSQSEFDLLQKQLKQTQMSRNTYLVRLISGATIFPKARLQELSLQYVIMNRLLRGMSTNINQIAKVANANHATPSAALLADMHQDIQTLRKNLQPLFDETRRTLWQS